MRSLPLPIRSGRRRDVALASAGCLLLAVPMLLLPPPFSLLAPIAVAALPVALIYAFNNPFVLCLLFIVFSFFRLHEVFPALYPLRIPSLLAAPTLAALGYHLLLSRTIEGFWSPELKAFSVFFGMVTLGVILAEHIPTALAYWTATYWKIGAMCVAVAWLTRRPEDFTLLSRALILSGCLVGYVAITNKLAGIGLVEGTRVTIGREIDSVLGDPNDLSLVLLFPLAFSVSLVARRTGWLDRMLGLAGTGVIVWAIICTQSRGGLLGILTVAAITGWRVVKSKSLLIAVGGAGALLLFAAMGINNRASGGAHEEGIDESAMGRIYAWEAAYRMALARPLNGVGLNNFTDNYWAYSSHWDGKNHAVHSTWFNVLSETGFPGFVAFLAIIGISFRTGWRSLKLVDRVDAPPILRAMSLAVFAGLAAFCVSGTFLTQAFTWPLYILLALTVAIDRYMRLRHPQCFPGSRP